MLLKPSSLYMQGNLSFALPRQKNKKLISRESIWFVITLLFIITTINSNIYAQNPFVLTVDQLKNWTPNGPTTFPSNISTIPLANRFTEVNTQLNPSLSNRMKVSYAPDGMSNLADYIEERAEFNLYNFTHWSYIDNIIWFGGTATETIQIPSAPWANTAHKNGVKVYGNVFFAPNVFGGSNATVSNFLEKDANGKFISAQKLKEISTFYKFDGWFINMETNTTSDNGQLMREFVEELKSVLPESQDVIWYDSMLTNGLVRWQNELNSNNSTFLQDENTRVSDGMFINFFWAGNSRPKNSRNTAQSIGRSEFDAFTGVDVWPGRNQSPFDSGGNGWMEALHDGNTPITSIALFAPNAVFQNSRYSNFRTIDTNEERDRFYNAEKHFFGGLDQNPETVDATGFKGLSNWIPAASTITSLPFKTSFNTGHGRIFSRNGAQTIRDWHDMGKQDVLPSWQFAITGNSDLKASFDFTNAYNGGTSLIVEGDLKGTGNTNLKLYKTKLPISYNTKVDITYALGSKGKTHTKILLAFTDNPTDLITLKIGESRSSGWNIKTVDLSKYEGKELAMIGFQFSSRTDIENFKINIGELKVFNGPAGDRNPPIANFSSPITSLKLGESVTFSSKESTGALFSIWFFPGGDPFFSTEENPTVTYNKIGTFDAKLIVGNHSGIDTAKKIDYISVDNTPITSFTVSSTTAQIGTSINFNNTSTNSTSWLWSFSGGSPSSSTEQNPTVVYNTVGAFDVSLTATNSDGSDTVTKERYISVLDNTGIDHTDPVGTGIITARAEINAAESKEKAFDNLAGPSNFTKWLDNGGVPSESDPSWIQIQFPAEKIVNTLTLVSPNDAADRDPEEFRLLGSNDGTNFTLLESWTGQFFTDPFVKKEYPFSNTDPYFYYRLEVTKNKDDVNLTQIAEIELIGPAQNLNSKNFISKDFQINLYPIPAKETITLEGEFPEGSTLNIISIDGRRILESIPITSNQTTLKLPKLNQGIFIITINNSKNKIIASRKISIK